MPDFVQATRLFQHNVYSAVASLARLGVPLERIVLEYEGGGWDYGTVLRQHPSPGSAISPGARVVLGIAGTGTLESLPFAMREESASGEFAGDRISALIDIPVVRARCFVHEGASFFNLDPATPITALRWIEDVMRSSATHWASAELYRAARLFSALHRIAGKHDAIPSALRFVYGLEPVLTELIPGEVQVESALATRLGSQNGRLGIDAVVGNALIAPHALRVSIGPVSLSTYLEQIQFARSRAAVYRMLIPAYLPSGVQERWVVEQSAHGYRLASRERPALLGISSYLQTAAVSA
jgi:hypothetical protein